jgi:dipeptidyl aminopeptidase/acylaminoacyl peptidase
MNPSLPAQNAAAFHESRATFESAGKEITVEVYTQETGRKHPGVLLFHGAAGMFMDGPTIRRFARRLVQNGFATFVVHYFERTGTLFARDSAIHKNFDAWRAAVNDAVHYVAAQSDIDAQAIGCFGYSLGGYLSLAQAAHDPRIGAVVELAGAIEKKHVDRVQRLPPLLILHGAKDRRVPVENAFQLEKIAQRLGVPYEIKIYRGEGHVLSAASQSDAASRAVSFFQKHFKGNGAR